MAKRKTTPQAPVTPEEMFQPIGEPEPEQKDPLEALSKQLAELSEEVKSSRSREERLQNLFLQLAAGNMRQEAPVVASPPTPPAVNLDFSKLPDPVKDPDGFRRGIQDQLAAQVPQAVTAAVSAAVKPVQAGQDVQSKVNALWAKFKERHKELAEHEDIARAVADRLAGQERQMGRDPLAVAMADPDGFVDRVAGDVNKVIEKIKGTGTDNGEDEAEAADRPAPQRTLGIPGQAAKLGAGGKPNGAGQDSTLISELKEMQKGIYY